MRALTRSEPTDVTLSPRNWLKTTISSNIFFNPSTNAGSKTTAAATATCRIIRLAPALGRS